jgi:hypothetical protein
VRVAALAALTLALTGCVQAPESEAAARAVERDARGARSVSCTDRSVRWFREGPPAEVFLCVARRDHGHCDRYVVERDGEQFAARVTERDTVDCALPAG